MFSNESEHIESLPAKRTRDKDLSGRRRRLEAKKFRRFGAGREKSKVFYGSIADIRRNRFDLIPVDSSKQSSLLPALRVFAVVVGGETRIVGFD
jgi:hypothetical protein